ncbi:hypothetical protein ONS96_008606 [Cadophora gregata f. sp. sojae]|nr:hypothetical protein ONS96_008606 [Cadophora gregata f. sp. sojae]
MMAEIREEVIAQAARQRTFFEEQTRINPEEDPKLYTQDQGLLQVQSSQQYPSSELKDGLSTQLQQLSLRSAEPSPHLWHTPQPMAQYNPVPEQSPEFFQSQIPQLYSQNTSPPRRGRTQGLSHGTSQIFSQNTSPRRGRTQGPSRGASQIFSGNTSPPRRVRRQGPSRGTSQIFSQNTSTPRRGRPLGPVRGTGQGPRRGEHFGPLRGRQQRARGQEHSGRYARVPLCLQQRTWLDEPPRYVEPDPSPVATPNPRAQTQLVV